MSPSSFLLANTVTTMMMFYMPFLLIGNAIIGLLEGAFLALVFKTNRRRAICLMIGFRGQTPEIIRRDVDLMLAKFKYGIVNLFTENRLSAGLMDAAVQAWFREEFAWLQNQPNINVLWKNTDFGVG